MLRNNRALPGWLGLLAVGILCAPLAWAAAPTLNSINPSMATAGDPSFTLNLMGANFSSTSVVQWPGQNDLKPVMFTSAMNISVTVPASYLATPGTANV